MSRLLYAGPLSSTHRMFFPLALVLFEFSVYLANDMILPGMPAVIHTFHSNIAYIPTAMTAYLLGGALLQWFLGPLSDRVGRRPVLLVGVLGFAVMCLATLLVTSITQFFVLRVIQGMGLCFVTAVGYAAIQETFEEATAEKVTALMANIALIAPLIGPLAGAALVTIAPWQSIFVFIAALTLLSFIGLYRFMPKISLPLAAKLPFSWTAVVSDYCAVLSHRRFMLGTCAVAFVTLPLLIWISQAPMILMVKANLSPIAFGLWQVPIFTGLIVGNFAVGPLVARMPIVRLVNIGVPFVLSGLCLAWVAMLIAPTNYIWLVIGMTISAIGCGISSAALTRLTLFSTPIAKGTASAAFSMVMMLIFTLGMEGVAQGYPYGGNLFFASIALIFGMVFFACARCFVGPALVPADAKRDTCSFD